MGSKAYEILLLLLLLRVSYTKQWAPHIYTPKTRTVDDICM